MNQTIFTLYQLGFAEVEDWSPIQLTATPKQAISVLIRRKRAGQKNSRSDRNRKLNCQERLNSLGFIIRSIERLLF